VHPNSLIIFSFDLNDFLAKKKEKVVQYSITSPLVVKTLWAQLGALLLIKGFPTIPKVHPNSIII